MSQHGGASHDRSGVVILVVALALCFGVWLAVTGEILLHAAGG